MIQSILLTVATPYTLPPQLMFLHTTSRASQRSYTKQIDNYVTGPWHDKWHDNSSIDELSCHLSWHDKWHDNSSIDDCVHWLNLRRVRQQTLARRFEIFYLGLPGNYRTWAVPCLWVVAKTMEKYNTDVDALALWNEAGHVPEKACIWMCMCRNAEAEKD